MDKDEYIAYLENLVNIYSNIVSLSESERKQADNIIKAHEQLQDAFSGELKEKIQTISAHESTAELSKDEMSGRDLALEDILDINRDISATLDKNHLLEKILRYLLSITGFSRGVLFLREKGRLIPELLENIKDSDLEAPDFLGRSMFIEQVCTQKITELKRDITETLDNQSISCVASPLLDGKEVLGVLYAECGSDLSFSTTQIIRLLDIFSSQAAISLRNALMYHTISHQIMIDTFTGLPSRTQLEKDIVRPGKKTFIIFNVDNFSFINSAYGSKTGDFVLKHIAKEIPHLLPANWKIYRLSGDEFVLLTDQADYAQAQKITRLIQLYFSHNPVEYRDIEISVSLSSGCAMGENEQIMRMADMALKRAKRSGSGTNSIFDKTIDMDSRFRDVFKWTKLIKSALKNNRIVPYFHGITCNKTGKTHMYECLVRLITDDGIILPDEFLAAAKYSGIYKQITAAMIEKSCAAFQNNDYEFSFNLSREDFLSDYLLEFIRKSTAKYHISPERVVFEVLEECSLKTEPRAFEFVNKLKSLGYKIAIDDFGSEYSNLSRLLCFDADYVKIDGAFVKNMANDGNCYTICNAITKLSHSKGSKVIAEYVTDKQVYDLVCGLRIDYSQGFYFNEPSAIIA